MAKSSSASSRAVVDYDANWDVKLNRGHIRIKLQSGQPITVRNIDNAAEYLAVLTLLQGQKTVFALGGGILSTVP